MRLRTTDIHSRRRGKFIRETPEDAMHAGTNRGVYHRDAAQTPGMAAALSMRPGPSALKQAQSRETLPGERQKNIHFDAFFSCMRRRLLYSASANSLPRRDESESRSRRTRVQIVYVIPARANSLSGNSHRENKKRQADALAA